MQIRFNLYELCIFYLFNNVNFNYFYDLCNCYLLDFVLDDFFLIKYHVSFQIKLCKRKS